MGIICHISSQDLLGLPSLIAASQNRIRRDLQRESPFPIRDSPLFTALHHNWCPDQRLPSLINQNARSRHHSVRDRSLIRQTDSQTGYRLDIT